MNAYRKQEEKKNGLLDVLEQVLEKKPKAGRLVLRLAQQGRRQALERPRVEKKAGSRKRGGGRDGAETRENREEDGDERSNTLLTQRIDLHAHIY